MLDKWIALPMRGLIAVYRYGVSPFIAGSCRYHPSCSAYAEEALATHGAFRGSWIALKRMARCHPCGDHGHDPVPELETNSADEHVLSSHLSSLATANADSRKGSR
jgi:putative membrane protein insertion efficiency factor